MGGNIPLPALAIQPQAQQDPVRSIKSLRARFAVLLISKIYRQMYEDTGTPPTALESGDPHTLGPLACKAMSAPICRPSNATPAGTRVLNRLYWDELPFAWMKRVSSAVSRERSQ